MMKSLGCKISALCHQNKLQQEKKKKGWGWETEYFLRCNDLGPEKS